MVWGGAGHGSVGGKQFYSGSFVLFFSLSLSPTTLFIMIITVIITNNILFQLSNHSYLNPQVLLFFFKGAGRWSEQAAEWYLAANWG